MTCPCGRSVALEGCCGPILEGHVDAATAETLMRARYTAFATQQIGFILASHHPKTRVDVDPDAVARSSKGSRWLGLDVLRTEDGLAGDERGWVEFKARYETNGREMVHHELSLFERHQGRWYFHSGHEPKQAAAVPSQAKVGRNQTCPCGSGKKFKKCCGGKAAHGARVLATSC